MIYIIYILPYATYIILCRYAYSNFISELLFPKDSCIFLMTINHDLCSLWSNEFATILNFSYTPKNTAPPIDIQRVLGTTPAKRPLMPNSCHTLPSVYDMLCFVAISEPASASIIRVFATSRGVVTAEIEDTYELTIWRICK